MNAFLVEDDPDLGETLTQILEKNEFRVEDNGPGIPEERLDDLFEPFVRGDTARRRDGGSVGLGLAIARETAKAIDMSLTARNRPESGACFYILLKK